MEGAGDHAVDKGRQSLEAWWKVVCQGTVDDAAALHTLVMSATEAQIQRDRKAAADFANTAGQAAASTER
ncbi:hypothetical protein [Leifsonia sp. P73]|uniref:hypothetical protein n=1 Tax=Leifsonia sp. P73 TaxID=3423959 RepID=UPI003DA63298